MDLREKKTLNSITNAFLVLRSKKPPERITIKELAEAAQISKATFYLHYKDIYDLSEKLQNEVIKNVMDSIPHPEYFLTNYSEFIKELFHAFYSQQSLIEILFSGEHSSVLPMRVEKEIINFVRTMLPQSPPDYDMILTYTIQGGHYVYSKYVKEYGIEKVIEIVDKASSAVRGAFFVK